jgi:hypothetical protein
MLRNTLVVGIVSIILIFVLELAARMIFPDFKGHLHASNITLGKQFYMSKDFPIRVPAFDHTLTFDRPLLLVLGDSISHGYGMAYEDIYWAQLQRRFDLRLGGARAPQIVSLSYGGNNLNDSRLAVQRFLAAAPNSNITKIIYQFNFNDIVPDAYGRLALQGGESSNDEKSARHNTGSDTTIGPVYAHDSAQLLKTLTRWRYEYLNHSVLFRVTQHYAGQLTRKTSGTCEKRGIDALGPYTWSFGSVKYLDESNALWDSFANALTDLKKVSAVTNAQLRIFISPLVFDIDPAGKHPYFNHLNYDFSCARINASERLHAIAHKLSIPIDDPTAYMRSSFEQRIKEGNFTPFFFTADENHVTPVAATLMAEYLEARIER